MHDANSLTKSVRRFDWAIRGYSAGLRYPFDLDLYRFNEAAITPTIGAIVPGWLLVIPRMSAFCFAELPVEIRRHINRAIDVVRNDLHVFGGRQYLFEHGSRHCGSKVGCGVDHAHAHLFCLESDLLKAALGSAQRWSHFLRQGVKVDLMTKRTIHHEDAETVFG
jgi:ATP adenylyltransferase